MSSVEGIPVNDRGGIDIEVLRRRNAQRSPRARSMDLRKRAKRTLSPDAPADELADWWNGPGRVDLEGVDTPPEKKKVKRTRRKWTTGKGEYSPSYYAQLERELRRAERNGDTDTIIAVTREMIESMDAEGEEIQDARAYLEDSRYDEITDSSQWKRDHRALNRAYKRKMMDEQVYLQNTKGRARMGRAGRRRHGLGHSGRTGQSRNIPVLSVHRAGRRRRYVRRGHDTGRELPLREDDGHRLPHRRTPELRLFMTLLT